MTPSLQQALTALSTAALCATLAAAPGSAMAQDERSGWNASPEPDALYGHCQSASSMGSKLDTLPYVGESVDDVLAIKVLRCAPFTFGSGFAKVACPAGSVYAFCMRAPNDGRGNDVTLGVLKADARTVADAPYDGCPAGSRVQSKLVLLRQAGRDPRTVDAIEALSCAAATVPDPVPATPVDCPPHGPFTYCVGTPADGLGNAVVLGVVRTNSTGDPAGLYGECDQQIRPGFASKASVLALVGKSATDVGRIEMLSCAVPWGYGPGFPPELHVGSCVGNPWVSQAQALRFDYCVWGTDARNAGIVMGVSGR